jgi:hypothetical protein
MHLHVLCLDDFSVERVSSSVYVLKLPIYERKPK